MLRSSYIGKSSFFQINAAINVHTIPKNNILYTPIEGVIAILKIAITLPKTRNDKIRLTDEVTIFYKRKKEQLIKIVLSKGSYSIDQFNQLLTKNNEILTMYWKPPIIENYQMKIPDLYTFIASNLLFESLGITNYTINLSQVKSSLFKGAYQTTLTPPPKNICFYCNQTDEISNEINGQSSKLLYSWDVSESQGDLTYSPKHAVNSNHLIFLQLSKTCHHLEFALLDSQNNEIIPKSFYLQLYSKNDDCIR